MTTISILCIALILSSPQDPVETFRFDELTAAVEEDGRRRWTRDGRPVTGPVRERYENGMRLETSLVDGYEHGIHRLFQADGRLAREVPMRTGREHGRVRMWRGDGRPYIVEYYRDGEPRGPQLGLSASGETQRFALVLDGEEVPWTLDALEGWEAAGATSPGAHVDFWRAVVLARGGDLAASLDALRKSFAGGYPTPMDAIGTGVLARLAEDPGARPGLVEAWLEHARESSVVMVAPDEPGTPFLLSVRVVDASTGAPIPGAGFRMHHTDAAGYYFPEETTWNVRLYTATRADREGRVQVRTIRPGYYAERFDPDGVLPAHVHFAAGAEGYEGAGGEARFSDDERRENDPEPALLIRVGEAEGGLQRGELTVSLQPCS